MRAAYGWHMRAGAWATNRHIAAARISWERARQIADALPDEDPNGSRMRIAARTMLCGTGWRVHVDVADRFDELRELCDLAGDKSSLAIGLTGVVAEHMYYGRVREASRAASEQLALLDSIGDPALTVAVAFVSFVVKYNVDEADDLLRVSTSVIDAAGGDPAKGDLIMGSPLALALVWRGIGGWWLGRTGWRQDLDDAIAIAKCADPLTHATVVSQRDGFAVTSGVLRADDAWCASSKKPSAGAERLGDDTAMGLVKYALGGALLERDEADRDHGLELMVQLRDMCLGGRFYLSELPAVEAFIAREHARRGDCDGAIPVLRNAMGDVVRSGQRAYEIGCIRYLVEALLVRGTESDVAEAEEAVERLANLRSDSAVRDIMLLRLRALLARAHGDEAGHRDWVSRYRAMAESLGFEGHLDWAEAMA